ncbi:hypothetical protein PASE110613_02195 [Paenibacillus sediminis]
MNLITGEIPYLMHLEGFGTKQMLIIALVSVEVSVLSIRMMA